VDFAENTKEGHAQETGSKAGILVAANGADLADHDAKPLDLARLVAQALETVEAENRLRTARLFPRPPQYLEFNPEVLTVLRITAEGQTAAHDAIMSDPERRVDETRAAAIEDETGEIARVDKAMLRILPPSWDKKLGDNPRGATAAIKLKKTCSI
jgi:hypothetical protein